jgi:hypothetical protein
MFHNGRGFYRLGEQLLAYQEGIGEMLSKMIRSYAPKDRERSKENSVAYFKKGIILGALTEKNLERHLANISIL